MDRLTMSVSDYIKDKGIQISKLSERTQIPYGVLHPCISGRRNLRAE